MGSAVAQHLLPLILPTIAYVLWIWYLRKRADELGGQAPEITRGGLFWSAAAGLVLMIVSFVALAVFSGVDPGTGGYQSPRLEDGRIIPPKFK